MISANNPNKIGMNDRENPACTVSCVWLFNSLDRSLPGSSVHGIFQARILEQVTIFYSRWPSRPWDFSQVSCTVGRFFTAELLGKPCKEYRGEINILNKVAKEGHVEKVAFHQWVKEDERTSWKEWSHH